MKVAERNDELKLCLSHNERRSSAGDTLHGHAVATHIDHLSCQFALAILDCALVLHFPSCGVAAFVAIDEFLQSRA